MVTRFQHDSVVDYQPISFAGTFVRKMRKANGLANIPSIRTTIAIPQFLTARYFRKETLDPMDYYDAAVYNTPYEDQKIARKIAYEMLFPKQPETSKPKSATTVENTSQLSGLDQIMGELSHAGFDDLMEVMDQETDLDDLMEDQQEAWDFLESLLQSSEPADQARLRLLDELDSEYAIVQHSLNSRQIVDSYLSQQLAKLAGTWSPQVFDPASQLTMNNQLLRQAQMPWEVASALAIAGHQDLDRHLHDILDQDDANTLGNTLRYLREIGHPPPRSWQDKAFDKIKSISDYYEMLRGLGEYRAPPKKMMDHTAAHDIGKGMDLAAQIEQQFGQDLAPELFEKFLESATNQEKSLQQVQDATYDDGNQSWANLLKKTVSREINSRSQRELTKLAKKIISNQSPRLSSEMKRSQTYQAKDVATQSLEQIPEREQFLPELEYLLEYGIQPKLEETIAAGKNLGIPEEQIAEYFRAAIKVLQAYVSGGISQPDKYDRVVRKISRIPQQKMEEMMEQALANDNTVALAALSAADLGTAMKAAHGKTAMSGRQAQQVLADSLDKGIGGGTNLLKQWFIHRRNLPAPIKDRLKAMMRETLLEIGMDWANRSTGSSEEGIIPETQTRPYRPGDELDLIDIEGTLDTLMMSGKTLEQITEDELMVTETSKGKTAMGVLIDISGSMSGQNLAMCAIAVVMLLGKLEAKEIAIALFESNTHTIKGFEDQTELDRVADELLDLQAKGGTRADAALRWITEEFDTVVDSEVKILYFLSDFYLAEQKSQLTQLCEPMNSLGVRMLAAHHGRSDTNRMQHMVDFLDGSSMKIKDFDSLPMTISEAIHTLQ